MSTRLEPQPLPIGVVSADAIEQLDPFVPKSDPYVDAIRGTALACEEPVESAAPRSPSARALQGANRFQHILTALPLVLFDALSLMMSLFIAAACINGLLGGWTVATLSSQTTLVVAGYFLFGVFHGLFPGSGLSPVVELRQSVISVWAAFCLMLVLNLTFGVLSGSEWLLGVIGVIFATLSVPLSRMFVRKLVSKTNWWGERAIIIGAGPQGRALFEFYSRAMDRGLRPVGLIDSATVAESQDDESLRGLPYLGSIGDFKRLNARYNCRWAIIAPGGCKNLEIGQVVAQASNVPNLLILPSQFPLPSLWARTRECAGVMGVHLRDHLQNPLACLAKRCIDVMISLTAIIVFSPLLLFIMVMVKIKSPGPVFFGHTRIGREGKLFKAWKFRSMVTDADVVLEKYLEENEEARQEWFEDHKLKDDPRIISGIGHFIRKTSLDELPQLWNVLKGEMSIVGPRPIVEAEIDRYREMYQLYLRVRPGITGLWQVSGRNDTSYEQRVRLDSYYVCNWSLWLDAYLVLRTIRTIILREGAY